MASLSQSQLKKRKPNFSDTEILNFLKILERRRSLINGWGLGESSLFGDALLGAWNEVAEEYSATAMVPRNGEELRSKFTDLKSRTKKRLKQIKNQQTPNGGVPSQIKPYEELVLQLASRDPLNGLNDYVDTFSESPVKEEPIETEDEEFKVIPAEPDLIPIRVAPIPQRSASKRKKPFIDDFDREMLEIAKRNVALQEQRLIETKLSNSLLRTIANKLGCQCQNKS